MDQHRLEALASKAWPFQEAQLLIDRLKGKLPEKGYVLFETGYGPSGLPHIGTFGEVARTSMVRHAFEFLTGMPTKLFAVSDDMDGLRKIPDNIPNQAMVREHLGKPLTSIPDPFGTHESFGHHMNARLRAFLDQFGFEYEFKSATECYRNGTYDKSMLLVLKHYDAIMEVMLPTLGEERQATYSPILPICPETGRVLQVPLVARDNDKGTITYINERSEAVTVPVTGGHCKLQWKADWGMRWVAFEVDYEMHGKDLISSAELSSKICHITGGNPPVLYKYELFLDEKGQKISKSKGNGITMDEWLRYAPTESLSLYMYQSPSKAKRLYFDVIPKQMDDYLTYLQKYAQEEVQLHYANPLWHIHRGKPPLPEVASINFSLLLNLASACNPEDKTVLWGFISRYVKGITAQNAPLLDKMAEFAVQYYHDFVKPAKQYRLPTETERLLLEKLMEVLRNLPASATAEEIQNHIYELGKTSFSGELKDFFKAMYEILLGQSQGPRLGSFIALYGINETLMLIEKTLTGNVQEKVASL